MDIYSVELEDINKRIDHYLNDELEDISRSAFCKS